ncbi:hypothetical protein [Halomicronema hongdechloris]|nr:hypothetical protein [Halomicronema hongdechloris]
MIGSNSPYYDHQHPSHRTSHPQYQQALKSSFSRIFAPLLKGLTAGDQPRIHYRQHGSGSGYWQVYDPVSQRHHRFATEQEVLSWLEQRYYQR